MHQRWLQKMTKPVSTTKHTTHTWKGLCSWKKKEIYWSKKEFEKASLLDVSDGQAQKRIDKCESKTGTTWSWKSKLWTFLKWAATIWIVWWSAYALYKWRNGEGKDSKPDIPSAVDDITTQIKNLSHYLHKISSTIMISVHRSTKHTVKFIHFLKIYKRYYSELWSTMSRTRTRPWNRKRQTCLSHTIYIWMIWTHLTNYSCWPSMENDRTCWHQPTRRAM